MGGLRRYMPITYWTCLLGSLSLIGFPGFAGFFSKDGIIEAVSEATRPGAGLALFAVIAGVFITSLYSFRMFFLVFHGQERMDEETRSHAHESPWVITLPLVLLAIPSVLVGWWAVGPMLFGDFFGSTIFLLPENDVLGRVAEHYTSPLGFLLHGLGSVVPWLSLAGVATAWYLYLHRPDLPGLIQSRLAPVHGLLVNKYYFDAFNERVLARGSVGLGQGLWRFGDVKLIDGALVNGTARLVSWTAAVVRHLQSGYLYHYAFAMSIGLALVLGWILLRG